VIPDRADDLVTALRRIVAARERLRAARIDVQTKPHPMARWWRAETDADTALMAAIDEAGVLCAEQHTR
jgi:hypothetical protein